MLKSREKELEKVRKTIKEYYLDARCGIYNTRNIAGDPMVNIFKGEFFDIDICFYYEYFEVFGCTDKEFNRLKEYYENLKEVK